MKKNFLIFSLLSLFCCGFVICSCTQNIPLNGCYSYYYDVTGSISNFKYDTDGTTIITITEDTEKMNPLFAEGAWVVSDDSNYQDYNFILYYTINGEVEKHAFVIRQLGDSIYVLDESTHRPSSDATVKFSSGSPDSSSFTVNYVNKEYGISGSTLNFERK